MKLILASQGFTTEEIAKEVSKVVGKDLKDINIAIINEAYTAISEDRTKRWLINELSNISKYIGGNIDFVNFRAYDKQEIKKRLFKADLIYIVGGKGLVLSELFNQTDTIEVIKELAKEKVIMGTSAGSVVLGTQIKSESFWKERYNTNISEIKYEELELVNFNIIPHYLREDHRKWDKEFLERTLSENPFPVYAIKDTQILIYDDGKIRFVGGEPEVFGKKL